MKPWEIVISLTNAMIGGLILVLPILTVQGGSLMTLIIILVTGFFSYYSCYICVIHLGNHEDLDKAFFYHFNQNRFIRIAYELMVFLAILFGVIFFFSLICLQWVGLFGESIAIPLSNLFFQFFLLILLNYFHLGPKLLAYGLVSIVGYLIFLIWVIATAPSGSNTLPLFGTNAVSMASAMGQAYTIQAIFIPVLRQLPDTKNYAKYTLYTYIIGTVIYIYIAYMGAFGIINRTAFMTPPQTIESYFKQGDPQVSALEIIYLVHLYSAVGEFLLVSKKRFFGICNVTRSNHGEMFKIHEFIYFAIMIGICCTVYMTKFSIENLITINGGIIGFFFIYLMPALMHLKCLYLCQGSKNSQNGQQEIELENETPKHQNIQELQSHLNSLSQKERANSEIQKESEQKEVETKDMSCLCKKPKKWLQVIDIVSMLGMVILGAFIMVDGFISVINS